MDRQQLPARSEPDMPAQTAEIRMAERSTGHEARRRGEADA